MLHKEIIQTIQNAIPNAEIHISDPLNDGTHLEAIVISPAFENLSRVKQQQLVMHALKDLFQTKLHALKLQTHTPQSWTQQ